MEIKNCLLKISNNTPACKRITNLITLAIFISSLFAILCPTDNPFSLFGNISSATTEILFYVSLSILICNLLRKTPVKKKASYLQSTPLTQQSLTVKTGYSALPRGIPELIFSYLDPDSIETCAALPKWESVARTTFNTFDLKKLFPNLVIVDESYWQTHAAELVPLGVSVSDAPPLDKLSLFSKLKIHILKESQEKRPRYNCQTCLLTIPKGLTLKKFIKFCNKVYGVNSRIDAAPIFRISFLHAMGNITIPKTYRMIISNIELRDARSYHIITGGGTGGFGIKSLEFAIYGAIGRSDSPDFIDLTYLNISLPGDNVVLLP